MPAAVVLDGERVEAVTGYVAAMRTAGRKTGRSTVQAARTFCAKLQRAGGWEQLSRPYQLDAICKARSFASWLMVTGQLTVHADVFGHVYLWLGNAARTLLPRRPRLVRGVLRTARNSTRRHRTAMEHLGQDHCLFNNGHRQSAEQQ